MSQFSCSVKRSYLAVSHMSVSISKIVVERKQSLQSNVVYVIMALLRVSLIFICGGNDNIVNKYYIRCVICNNLCANKKG
jgi:hypothetical protein